MSVYRYYLLLMQKSIQFIESQEREVIDKMNQLAITPLLDLQKQVELMINQLNIQEQYKSPQQNQKQLDQFTSNLIQYKNGSGEPKMQAFNGIIKLMYEKQSFIDILPIIVEYCREIQIFFLSLVNYCSVNNLINQGKVLCKKIRLIYKKGQYYRETQTSENYLCEGIIHFLKKLSPDDLNTQCLLGALTAILKENIALKKQFIEEKCTEELAQYFCLNFTTQKMVYFRQLFSCKISNPQFFPIAFLSWFIKYLLNQLYFERDPTKKRDYLHTALFQIYDKSTTRKRIFLQIMIQNQTPHKSVLDKHLKMPKKLSN